MIDPKQVPQLKGHIDTLKNQLHLFSERVKSTSEIDPRDKSSEDERKRILGLMASCSKKLGEIVTHVDALASMEKKEKFDLNDAMNRLSFIDRTFYDLKISVAEIAEEQYACKLGIFKQEIFNSIGLILDPLDFVLPNIRYEIEYLGKHYRAPQDSQENAMSRLEELVDDMENNRITLDDFMNGYANGNVKVLGYNKLRCSGGFFSCYQFYENPSEAYKSINECYYEFCKALEPFLKDKKDNPEFVKFYDLVRDRSRTISKMTDIFEIGALVSQLGDKVKKKYSYNRSVRRAGSYSEKFDKLKNNLVVYNDDEIKAAEKALAGKMTDPAEKNRCASIMKDIRLAVKNKAIPFSRLESIFEQLEQKDFNVVVREKDVADITITIAPHHEKKYGREILERINAIIQEVDFWYPLDRKKSLFDSISQTTLKIQADEPVDKQEFLKVMQGHDREIEQKIRSGYPEKIKELKGVFSALAKLATDKLNREKLERRLANKKVWDEIKPRMDKANKCLMELTSGKPSYTKHVNKFVHIRCVTDELCQVLYDLSMQLFILFHGVDGKLITKMTNILCVFKDAHDVSGLWATFSHYFRKNSIPNFQVNETMIMQNARLSNSKSGLSKL